MIVWLVLLSLVVCAKNFQNRGMDNADQDGENFSSSSEDQSSSPASLDFQIYSLIDSLNSLHTEHRTFYDLLKVSSNCSMTAISAAFRTASRIWHPDKHVNKPSATQAHSIYTLLASAKTVLTSEIGRARYDWILNKAPPWHRSQTMLASTFKASPKLSVVAVIAMAVFGFLVARFIALWCLWVYQAWWIWSSKRTLNNTMGRKEMKRIRRKLDEGGDAAILALWTSDAAQLMSDADKLYPPKPSFFYDLFLFPRLIKNSFVARSEAITKQE